MPTYEYLCDDCHFRFEEFQSITADPLKNCPNCGGSVQKLISSGNGFIFKGSGFYITDYKKPKDSSKRDAKKEDKKEKKPTASETNNTE